MNKKEKDYFFYINWCDIEKNPYRVGILAQIDKRFYLRMNNKKSSEFAYNRGYIGIPGFQDDKVYSSDELFNFFKSRILDKHSDNPCEELSKNSAVSMVDSFTLEEVPEILKKKCKQTILKMYELENKKSNENQVSNNTIHSL